MKQLALPSFERLLTIEYPAFGTTSYFRGEVSVSERFFWDNGSLPFVFAGVKYLDLMELIMKKSNRFKSNIEFVTLKLTTADKAKFDEWAKVGEKKLFPMLDELGEGGYKISISPDFNNACVIASITATDNSTHNVGLCMTSRGETIVEALLVACYKHFVLADGSDWLAVAGKNEDNWG
jgi:hypothetical protein